MFVKSKGHRLIHVVSSLNVGGAERFVLDLITKQHESNDLVEILSFGSKNEALVSVAEKKKIKVNCIPHVSTIGGQFKLLCLLAKFNIVHIHTSYALKPLSIVMWVLHRKNCLYTRHGAAKLNSEAWKVIHHRFRPFIKAMTFVSSEAKSVFRKTYDWKDIPMEVIANGVVAPAISKQLVSKKLRLGSVGRLVPLKHQICLLTAVSNLSKAYKLKIAIDIFGDGECEYLMKSFTEENLMDVEVCFHGMLTNRDEIYNTFDVLVVTSETEGLSLAIMESMVYGKPAVASNVGGNSTLVKPDKTGWLFEYDDNINLTRIINELIGDAAKVLRMGENSKNFILKKYSIDVSDQEYKKLYWE